MHRVPLQELSGVLDGGLRGKNTRIDKVGRAEDFVPYPFLELGKLNPRPEPKGTESVIPWEPGFRPNE